MDGAHIKIGPTEEELTDEAKEKRKEVASKRVEDKKRKAQEKASTSQKKPRVKTSIQIQREADRVKKREENLAERERKKVERLALAAERTLRVRPPTAKQIEARKKALTRREVKKETAATASRTIRLHPSQSMSRVLKIWMGCYRVVYNRALAISNATKPPKSFNYHGFIRAAVCNEEAISEPWLKRFPSGCRKFAAKDACDAFWSNHAKKKKNNGNHEFRMRFKSKKDQSQVLKVESAHIKVSQEGYIRICPTKSKTEVVKICSKMKLKFDENMLNVWYNPKDLGGVSIDKDVVITMDKLGRFWMHCPYRREVVFPDNQGGAPHSQWTALDPGSRVFLTGYAPSGDAFKLGVHASDRVLRLGVRLDGLVSKTDSLANILEKLKKRWCAEKKKRVLQKLSRMRRAQQRMRYRIKDLVTEMHWKCARWLCDRYTDIIIPTFATSEMVCKDGGRCIRSKTARNLMTLSHFNFRQRLLHTASMCGTRVYIREEDYTSKTCTNCGCIHDGLGSSEIFKCPTCGLVACRDGAASRNIFLKNTIVTFTC
jgi:putative transposase